MIFLIIEKYFNIHISIDISGENIKTQSLRIVVTKRELFKEDQARIYSAFGELDMLISNCR